MGEDGTVAVNLAVKVLLELTPRYYCVCSC